MLLLKLQILLLNQKMNRRMTIVTVFLRLTILPTALSMLCGMGRKCQARDKLKWTVDQLQLVVDRPTIL